MEPFCFSDGILIPWGEGNLEFHEVCTMVIITFPDQQSQRKALGFLLGRFSGKVLHTGEHLVPEAALEALAQQNIVFTVHGKASYEQQSAALRGAAAGQVQ
jgi:hypothetical protein